MNRLRRPSDSLLDILYRQIVRNSVFEQRNPVYIRQGGHPPLFFDYVDEANARQHLRYYINILTLR